MITVNNPAITIDKLLIAPSISPNFKAFDVPIATHYYHMAKPIATGCLILNNLQILSNDSTKDTSNNNNSNCNG